MSEYELEKKYHELDARRAYTHYLKLMPPAKYLFQYADEHTAKQIRNMYRAMNDSIKAVQVTIKYQFKDPLILWAALQDYAVLNTVKFFPHVEQPDQHNDLFKVGRSLLEQMGRNLGYSNEDSQIWMTRHLAHRAFAMNIHKHVYRYNAHPITPRNLPQHHESLARRVIVLLGAVWVDSGEQWSSVERYVSAMDLYKNSDTHPQPQPEILLPLRTSTVNTVEELHKNTSHNEPLENESEQKADDLRIMPPEPVSFDPRHRPMSEYELEKKYYENKAHVKHKHKYLTPPLYLLPDGDSRAEDVMVMYRAMNESLKAVQAAIQYNFKDPSLLWAALQNYPTNAPEFFPPARQDHQRYLAGIGKNLVPLAIELYTYNNNTRRDKLDGMCKMATKLLPNRGARKYIHKHVYRDRADQPMSIEQLKGAVAAILGVVWLDSGKNWRRVEGFLAAMDITWIAKK